MSRLQTSVGRFAFGSKQRQRVWKKIAAQVHNGIPLEESLEILLTQARTRNSSLAAVYADILAHMASGHNLGTALTGYASSEEIMLIASGQKAGKVEEGLRLATTLLVAKQKIQTAVISALAYPLFLALLCIALLLVVSIRVVPQLAVLVDPTQWTGAAGVLYTISNVIGSFYGIVLLTMLLAACVAVFVTLPLWTGKRRVLVENIPPWSIYRLTVGSVWLFTVATLMRSGMQLAHILENMLSSDSISSYLYERVQAIAVQSRAGRNLGEAMYEAGTHFPDVELIDDMRVYARLPGFQERLYEMANDWMVDGVELIQRNAKVLNTIFITGIIAQVGGLAMAVVSLQSQLLPQGV